MSEEQGFMDVLAGFIPVARDTEVGDGGYFIPKGEKHLSLNTAEFEPGTNDYGPFVKATLTWGICDPGEDQDREFSTVYFVNTMKPDKGTGVAKLSFGGQDLLRLAAVFAGEPIADNNPVNAAAVIQGSIGAVIKAKCSARKNPKTGDEYPRVRPLSLEAIPATTQ
jgi:hypothetical protein